MYLSIVIRHHSIQIGISWNSSSNNDIKMRPISNVTNVHEGRSCFEIVHGGDTQTNQIQSETATSKASLIITERRKE